MKSKEVKVKAKPKKMSVCASKKSAYDTDFYKWVFHQAQLLKNEEYSKLDLQNVIEELESLGNSYRTSIRSYLIRLIMHRLKILCQPEKHTKSWDRSIVDSQVKIESILIGNPSLRRELKDILDSSYHLAVRRAAVDTGLDKKSFPAECPWTIKELLNDAT